MHLLLGLAAGRWAALETAVERARRTGDELTVAAYGADADAAAEGARERLASLDFEASVRRIEGDPGSQLVELAGTGGYDRILLPGGQRSPLGKIRIDEVMEFVILNAPVSVTLLR